MQRWVRAVVLAAAVVAFLIILFSSYAPSRDVNTAVEEEDFATEDGETTAKEKVKKEEEDSADKSRVQVQEAVNDREQAANIAEQTAERRRVVVEMFRHAWNGYSRYAWGKDELMPTSRTGTNSYGLGVTIIDSLDTMWLMELTEEFAKAREWVANSLDISGNHRTVNVFETNIRVLGGLLAAYHLSNDQLFLQKAVELGDRLLVAFKTKTGIPFGTVKLDQDTPIITSDVACIAELGSLQLEFRDLSHSTGDMKYQRAVDRALDVVQSHLTSGIATQEVYIVSGAPKYTEMTVGSRTDSYYEYLLKQWIQSGKNEETIRLWYDKSANQIISKFVKFSRPNHMAYVARLQTSDGQHYTSTMDHLSCFLPGLLALGYLNGFPESHLNIAKKLTNTCYQFYYQSPSGLSPESVHFSTAAQSQHDFHFMKKDNMLRPETVESLFVLYRVTKDPIYRDWGWEIAQAFQRHCRVDSGGYTIVSHIDRPHPQKKNEMESFFLAETLKYLFLLFSDDDFIPLDQWVFNTEAHPLPIWITY